MQENTTIKAIEAFAKKYNLKTTTVGQLAVGNRHAYSRINSGSASLSTERDILAWIEAEDARRSADGRGAA